MTSDDADRLVEADALLAKGDPRGELIVLQCGASSRERRRREHELLAQYGETWANLDGLASKYVYRRGFVDEITVDADVFAAHEEEIWRRAPRLRWVRTTGHAIECTETDLHDPNAEIERFMPRLARVLQSGRVQYFAANDLSLRSLKTTVVGYDEVEHHSRTDFLGPGVIRWLVRERKLASLRGLGLFGLEADMLEMLAAEPAAAQLEELEIHGSLLHYGYPRSADILARTELRPRRLVYDNRGTHRASDVAGLFSTPLMARVTDLEVGDLTWDRPEIVRHPVMKQLKRLSGYIFASGALEDIANEPLLDGIEELVIKQQADMGTVHDLRWLHDPKHLRSLRVLRFAHRPLTPEVLERFLASPFARRLELFEMGGEVYFP